MGYRINVTRPFGVDIEFYAPIARAAEPVSCEIRAIGCSTNVARFFAHRAARKLLNHGFIHNVVYFITVFFMKAVYPDSV